MAISKGGSASAASTSLTMPAGMAVGDLLVMHAFNSGAATAPTVPSGWKRWINTAGNVVGQVVAYRWCASTSDTSGTWTNATQLICEIYRGSLGGGDTEAGNATGTTITHPANFPAQTAGNSWVVSAVGHKTATSLGTTPSGLTARTSLGSGPIFASFDTNGGVASFAAKTSTANASSGNSGITVELLADKSGWDNAARGASGEFTLTADQLTAKITTNPAATTNCFGTLGRSTGKYVYKVTSGNLTSGLTIGLGSNGGTGTALGSSSSSVAWAMAGGVTCNGSSIGTAATWGASTALYVAVDFTNALIWFRVGTGGNWNNSGTANPDTGTGGFSLSGLSLSNAVAPARGAAASVGTETTGFVFDGTAASHGLTTFQTWDDLSTASPGQLTGVAASGAVGTLAPSAAVAETGFAATAAAGSVTAARSFTLSGQASVGALGTLAVSRSTALAGAAGTGQAGTLVASPSSALSGCAAASQVGSLAASVSSVLSGQLATGQRGSLAAIASFALSGLSASGQQGALTLPGLTVLSGQAGTAAQGSVSPGAAVALSGVSLSLSLGILTADAVIVVPPALTVTLESLGRGGQVVAVDLSGGATVTPGALAGGGHVQAA